MNFISRMFDNPGKKTNPHCTAVVAAAGASSRMNGENKLFSPVGGIPVIAMTLLALQNSEHIDDIVIVVRDEDRIPAGRLCCEYDIKKLFRIVTGGETRTESVYNGVMAAPRGAELIAIHDGCRPFVTDCVIAGAVAGALKYGAAAPAVPVKDTIKVAENGTVRSTPDRSALFAVQTPQVFDADLIKGALKNALDKKLCLTDDCMAAEAVGARVFLTEGEYENLKVTTPADLLIGETIIRMRKERAGV